MSVSNSHYEGIGETFPLNLLVSEPEVPDRQALKHDTEGIDGAKADAYGYHSFQQVSLPPCLDET